MDEVEKTADQVAIVDHGNLIANDTVAGIIQKSGSKNLEEAFIKLTGHEIRTEEDGAIDHLRQRARAWGRRS